jgi:hypothetical protein
VTATTHALRSPARALHPDVAAPLLPSGWLIALLFSGVFLWWALGLQGFIGPILALPMLAVIVVRRWSLVPSGFWLYLLFLLWVPVTFMNIDSFTTLMVAGWRYSIYIGAGILFVYVYNAPKSELPTSRLVQILASFWVFTALGGFLGMFLPTFEFTSPTEALLGDLARSDPLLYLMTHPSTALERTFLALPVHRPNAPFPYPNQWGSNFAMSLPLALAALATLRSVFWRRALWALLVLSVVPLVVALNRGSWLAIGIAAVYSAYRLARNRNVRALAILVGVTALTLTVVFSSPLGELITVRLENAPGDDKRAVLYQGSLELAAQSPILGWGNTVKLDYLVPGAPPDPPIGTHGQLWLIMVSHGVVPALLLFVGFLVWALIATGRRRGPPGARGVVSPLADADGNARFWCHVAILVAIVEIPYYELIAWGMPFVLTAAAVALREERADMQRSAGRARAATSSVAGTPA